MKTIPKIPTLLKIPLILVMIASCTSYQSQVRGPQQEQAQFEFPFLNPDLDFDERAEDLLSRLTLEEKVSLMFDQSPPIPRLGIDTFNWWSEALHGYAFVDSVTVFPQPIGMAASFNDELVFEIFNATSDEARAKYHQARRRGQENRRFLSLSVWTPNVNIFRDPRWGRGQETYGEDPFLMTRMGVQVVKGLQGPDDAKYRKLLAAAKHFAVHSGPEWSRHELNVTNVDKRLLYETYLPAFKALVQDADVRQVMCAYQRLEDEPCCSNTRLLQRILREDWGFEHVVVVDCDGITDFYTTHNISSSPMHASARAVMAGADLECKWEGHNYQHLPDAVESGLIREEDIDRSVLRILRGRFELGEFDDDSIVPWAQIPESVISSEEHRALSHKMSRQTMTLLHNKNDVLPLDKTSIGNLAVIGPNADDDEVLWGNYNGVPISTITILDGIKSMVPQTNVFYDKAVDLVDDQVTISYIPQLSADGQPGFKATYWNDPDFEGDPVITQHINRSLQLTTAGQHEFAPGVRLEGFSAVYEGIFRPETTEELVFKGGATGFFEVSVNGEVIESYTNWRTLITRIPYTFEAGFSYNIKIRYAQRENWQANIDLQFGREEDVDYATIVDRLAGIDTVIVAGGLSTRLEGEEMPVDFPGFKGGDRTDIELPAVQRNLLRMLKDAGKIVIFVNLSGSPIAFEPELESTDAILQAWYGGEAGGLAIAEVLFGVVNPSGKLPVTFYGNSDNLGDIEDYSMNNRTYRYTNEYLFPFGFGLSYTEFEFGQAELSRSTIRTDESTSITVPIKNVGDRDGTEVVQIYVRKIGDEDGPIRTLRGYQRVELSAGSEQNVTIDLPPSTFEFFNRERRKMDITPGKYVVYYGSSSDEKDLQVLHVKLK